MGKGMPKVECLEPFPLYLPLFFKRVHKRTNFPIQETKTRNGCTNNLWLVTILLGTDTPIAFIR